MRLCIALFLLVCSTCAHATSVFYTKGANTQFTDILPLSDGTFLLAGAAGDLAWLPDCEKIVLPGDAIQNAAPQGRIGFLMQVSADLKTVKRVASLPPGAVLELTKIRSTSLPGQPTGTLIVSGKRNDGEKTGYFLAKLNANFVDKAPSNFAWIRNISAGGSHRDAQP